MRPELSLNTKQSQFSYSNTNSFVCQSTKNMENTGLVSNGYNRQLQTVSVPDLLRYEQRRRSEEYVVRAP